MTKSKKKIILNIAIVCALLSLSGTLFVGVRRIQTQNVYESMATLRAEQSIEETAEENTEKTSAEIQTTTIEEATTNTQYQYKPNDNTKWLAINADYFGWIKVPGTNIDYPFVRSHDNKDYLTMDFNGNYSDAGTLFMDYRNLGNFIDKHTIIYGHYMKNKTLFHNLTLYHDRDYFEKNQIIEISGLYETKTYKIFSVYEISVDDYAFTLDFNETITYEAYLENLIQLSLHKTDSEVSPNQKLLTLVTCSYGVKNGRTIVHAIEM